MPRSSVYESRVVPNNLRLIALELTTAAMSVMSTLRGKTARQSA